MELCNDDMTERAQSATESRFRRPLAIARHAGRRLAALGLAAALLVPAGCGRRASSDASRAATDAGLTAEATDGALAWRTRLDRRQLSTAQRLELDLEAEAPETVAVEFPDIGAADVAPFRIVDVRDAPPALVASGRVRHRRTVMLEPFLPGDYTLPGLSAQFRDRADTAAEARQLQTTPLAVTVLSVFPDGGGEPQLADIAGPVPLMPSWRRRLGVAVATVFALAVLAGAAAWVYRRRIHRRNALPARPAHELALEQLEALLSENLAEHGRFAEFYQRLSDILRHYIENRFGLHAPERTTEEFMAELAATAETEQASGIRPEHRPVLMRFLTQCDLVKFAAHRPAHAEAREAVDTCKAFIMETRAEASASPVPENPGNRP